MINLDQGAVGSSMWKARGESRAFLLQVIIESFGDVLTCSWAGHPRNTKYMLRGFCTVPDGITLHSPFPEWYYLDPSIARVTSVLPSSQPEQEQNMGETFSLEGTNTPCQPRKHVSEPPFIEKVATLHGNYSLQYGRHRLLYSNCRGRQH